MFVYVCGSRGSNEEKRGCGDAIGERVGSNGSGGGRRGGEQVETTGGGNKNVGRPTAAGSCVEILFRAFGQRGDV